MFLNQSVIANKILLEQNIKLSDLVGWFDLTGVDYTTTKALNSWSDDDDAQVMTLILNGISFSFIEDPDDGYRSTLDSVIVGEFQEIENTFPPIKVYFTHVDEEQEHMIYGYVNTMDKYILRIGTDHTDDYYPTYTAEWNPKILEDNKKVV